jgi:hypothetical protein
VDSIDELDIYEAEKRLALYNEYRDAIRVFAYYVETELRAYLCNDVEVEPVPAQGGVYFKVTLHDTWIYEAERPQRFVPEVVIYEVGPVHVQRLRGEGE